MGLQNTLSLGLCSVIIQKITTVNRKIQPLNNVEAQPVDQGIS